MRIYSNGKILLVDISRMPRHIIEGGSIANARFRVQSACNHNDIVTTGAINHLNFLENK
jgi:hypothetical protein